MSARDPEAEVVPEGQARVRWAELLDRTSREKQRLLIARNGSPVAALVSVEDYERLIQLDQQREERFKALDRSWEAFADLADDDATIERKVAEAVTQARAKRRKERHDARAS